MERNPIKIALQKIIEQTFKKSFEKSLNFEIDIAQTKNSKFGDYATNIAMIYAKKINKNPREIAEKIVNNIQNSKIIEKIEIAGQGFINFFITNKCFIDQLKYLTDEYQSFFRPNIGNKDKIVIEYSQPNIAKPLGVHHLLSTIIGQSLNNIYEYLNFDVIRINHIGDWGTQFGKLIYAYKTWGNEKQILQDPINELLKLYIKFHEEAEKNPEIENYGREEFKKLENGDDENYKLWKWIRDISLQEVKKTYAKLEGITFEDKDYIGESFYNEMMQEILEEGKKKKIFYLSKGAYIADIDKNTTPLIVQKSDGTTTYATRDLAQIKYRSSLGITKNIMVVDVAQSLHFRQFFHVAKKLGLNKNKLGEVELIHVVFGRMKLPDKKMSTRKGTVILLDNLLDEAVERSYKLVSKLNPNISEDEKIKIAHISGLGSVKYNILSQNRLHDITFKWDKMIALDGNCAPYLQYTHARALSILRKNQEKETTEFIISDNLEKKLIKELLNFPDVLILAQKTNMPHHIATYIYHLATIYNTFYNSLHVLTSTDATKNTRIILTKLVAKILKISLNLLVIDAPDKM